MIVILTGMSGVGKTSLGKKISKILKYKFIDLDKQIEFNLNKPIKHIFSEYGENYFREKESQTLKYILTNNKKNICLSLGGGALLDEKNLALCLQSGILVWISLNIKILEHRLINSNKRPLLVSKHCLRDTIKHLLLKRIEHYQYSHIKIHFEKNFSQEYMTKEIITKINSYCEQHNLKGMNDK